MDNPLVYPRRYLVKFQSAKIPFESTLFETGTSPSTARHLIANGPCPRDDFEDQFSAQKTILPVNQPEKLQCGIKSVKPLIDHVGFTPRRLRPSGPPEHPSSSTYLPLHNVTQRPALKLSSASHSSNFFCCLVTFPTLLGISGGW